MTWHSKWRLNLHACITKLKFSPLQFCSGQSNWPVGGNWLSSQTNFVLRKTIRWFIWEFITITSKTVFFYHRKLHEPKQFNSKMSKVSILILNFRKTRQCGNAVLLNFQWHFFRPHNDCGLYFKIREYFVRSNVQYIGPNGPELIWHFGKYIDIT